MTKSNSLRSLKKKRRSISAVRKKERKCERHTAVSLSNQPDELTVEDSAEATNDEQKLQSDQEGEWLGWWNGSALADLYSWCQSSVKEVR